MEIVYWYREFGIKYNSILRTVSIFDLIGTIKTFYDIDPTKRQTIPEKFIDNLHEFWESLIKKYIDSKN